MWGSFVGLLILIALAAAVLWPRADFEVRMREGKVECTGRLPRRLQLGITRLLLEDLRLAPPLKIRGTWRRNGVHLRFVGCISDEDRQCVRNFFASDH